MNEDCKSEFIAELKKIQAGCIDFLSFRKWISENQQDLRSLISPGILIKLKRGGERQTMKAVASLLSACSRCRNICSEGVFLTRNEYTVCALKVAQSAQIGVLTQIARPQWFSSKDKHLGADGYFRCNTCDAMWTLVTPEHEDNGLWERIA